MKLQKGINLGGYLSQCVHTKEHYDSFLSEDDYRHISEMGFDHVRLPIDYNVLETEQGDIIEAGYQYVDSAISNAKKYHLDIIIDLHKAFGYDFNNANVNENNTLFTNPALQTRFINLWKTIAARYAAYEHVAFELLNEVVEDENASLWNELINKVVPAIREIAPANPIIYGGIRWNSATTLCMLDKPKYDNIIYTFHFYEPLIFTHQKAPWVLGMDMERTVAYPDSMDHYREISKTLTMQGDVVIEAKSETMGPEFLQEVIQSGIDAAKDAGVRLYCGEFGVIDRAPAADTLRWFTDVEKVFCKHNIGFALWSYKLMDFGFTDPHMDPVREDLLKVWFPDK